jgi:PAS domain S-box-containing protein
VRHACWRIRTPSPPLLQQQALPVRPVSESSRIKAAIALLEGKVMDGNAKTEAQILEDLADLGREISTIGAAENHQQRLNKQVELLYNWKEQLLAPSSLEKKLAVITDKLVEVFEADIARIWVVRESDLCEQGCRYAIPTQGQALCRDRFRCLQLMASSGRYPGIEGSHRRIPLGCRPSGHFAFGDRSMFFTNDVSHDPLVSDRQWAEDLGLVSFACYKLCSPDDRLLGVLAMFSRKALNAGEQSLLANVANTASQAIRAGIAEEALRKSEEKYRQVVDAANEGIWIFDAQERTTFVNSCITDMLGYAADEITGKSPSCFVHENDLRYFTEKMAARREGIAENYEVRFRRKDGRIVWMLIAGSPLFDREHSFQGSFGIFADITNRRAAEEELKEKESRLRTILNGSPISQFFINKSHRVLYWNKALEEYSGIKAEAVVGTNQHWRAFYDRERPCLSDLLIDEDFDKIAQYYQGKCKKSRLLEDAYEALDFFPRIGKQGSWLHFTAAPVRDSWGNMFGAIETLEDVTERMKAEELLRRAHDELEQRVEDRTNELAETVNQLNQEVKERICTEEQLQREQRTLEHLLRASDHERQLIAYEIHDGLAQHLAGAIMQFHSYEHLSEKSSHEAAETFRTGVAMLQQGHHEARRLISGVRPPILDELGIVAAITHLVNERNCEKAPKIEFHARVGFDRLDSILENSIYRIVQESLSNACKHSKSGQIHIEFEECDQCLHIGIQDWGIGFDPENVKENCYGLEGIRERVRLLGGKIDIQSAPEKGTLIDIELPLVPKA